MQTTRARSTTRQLPKSLSTSSSDKQIGVGNKHGQHSPKTFNEKASNQQSHLLDQQTEFSGRARVAQVLRWTSTAALIANDLFSEKSTTTKQRAQQARTPEAQSTVIGGRLMIGTNAEDDSHIPGHLQALLSDANKVKSVVQNFEDQNEGLTHQLLFAGSDTERTKIREQMRINSQQSRHLSQLHQFVADDGVFNAFSHTTRQEIEDRYVQENADTNMSASNYMNGLKSRQQSHSAMLRNLRSSLRDQGSISMASNTQGKHAEQRIIEDVIGKHDQEVERTKMARGFTVFSTLPEPSHLDMVVAGTKPPCAMCEVTERARQKVAQTGQDNSSPLVMKRYKDEHYQSGNLFPGNYVNTEDQHVHQQLRGQFADKASFPKTRVTARKRADSVASFKAFKDL
ncbi:hypothetical protein [Bacterioplanes sanyensis]|uniref:hypothetical protein n=1 Tax=Bacterioplanes sanyensis TaxID=1249553 RepID=UPI0012FDF030|nr:hypothetical protein [Bacterioplanes sanyensis]